MEVSDCAGPSGGLPNHTNEPLSDSQKGEIQAMISAEQEEIRDIDAEILRLLLDIDGLRSRRKVRTNQVASFKILLSPIKELPNEIIARIFEQYAHGPYPDPDANNRQLPWYLGHICSRWRAVAWAIPNLWNFLVCNVNNPTESNANDHSLEIANYLLLRTGQSPISCLFRRRGSHSFSVKCFFELFSHHAGRLRSLEIDGVRGISSLSGIHPPTLASLKILDLHFYPAERVSPTFPITLFNNTPLLRDVSISAEYGHSENSDLLSLHLPWGQLTHLDISQFKLSISDSLRALFLKCPNLVAFSLYIPVASNHSRKLPVIVMLHLETLILKGDGGMSRSEFLQYLRLPSLKCLSSDFTYQWSLRGVAD